MKKIYFVLFFIAFTCAFWLWYEIQYWIPRVVLRYAMSRK